MTDTVNKQLEMLATTMRIFASRFDNPILASFLYNRADEVDAIRASLPEPGVVSEEYAEALLDAYDDAVIKLFADEETGCNHNNCQHWMQRRIGRLRRLILRTLATPPTAPEVDPAVEAHVIAAARELGYEGMDFLGAAQSLAERANDFAEMGTDPQPAPAAQGVSYPAEVLAALKDPSTVHTLMLRGVIAKPSWRTMVDLHGEVPNGEDAQLARIAELQEQLAATALRTKQE